MKNAPSARRTRRKAATTRLPYFVHLRWSPTVWNFLPVLLTRSDSDLRSLVGTRYRACGWPHSAGGTRENNCGADPKADPTIAVYLFYLQLLCLRWLFQRIRLEQAILVHSLCRIHQSFRSRNFFSRFCADHGVQRFDRPHNLL